MAYKFTRQEEVRKAFWGDIFEKKPKKYYGLRHNDLPAEIRQLFSMYVDDLARDESISDSLAKKVTLG